MNTDSEFEGRRFLVTGGTGFVGGRIVERLVLEHGASVTVLVRNLARAVRLARFGSVRLVFGEISDRKAVMAAADGCEYVIHCAHDMLGTFPRHNRRMNVRGTANVIEAARTTGARMVHMSSAEVYGRPGGDTLDETLPYRGRGNFYCEAKRRVERILWREYGRKAFPVCVLQPTVVYGPYAGWTVGSCQRLLSGRLILPAMGGGVCNPVYIDDVVDAVFLALKEEDAVGEHFVISGPDHVSWHEWFARHEVALGITSLLPVSPDMYAAAMRHAQSRRGLAHLAKSLATDGYLVEVARQAMRTKMVDSLVKGCVRAIGEAVFTLPGCAGWDTAARRVFRHLRARVRLGSSRDSAEHYVLPADGWEAALYASSTKASIAKARKRLGYEPRYTFEQGMELTARFIRWAIPECTDSR